MLGNDRFGGNERNRSTSLQWSLNLPTKIWLVGFTDRQVSSLNQTVYSNMGMSLNRKAYFMSSQFSMQANTYIDRNTYYSKNSRLQLGTRLSKRYALNMESQLSHNGATNLESISLNAQYYSKKLYLNSSLTRIQSTDDMMLQIGVRFQSKQAALSQQLSSFQGGYNYWSSISTAWNVADNGKWLGSSSSGTTSGLEFRAFHDENGNGVKDKNEITLNGLVVQSNGSRSTNNKEMEHSSLILDMIPHHQYWLTFDTELIQHPEFMVLKPRILVQAPSDGIRTMYVPVRKSYELNGVWDSTYFLLKATDVQAVLIDEKNGSTYKIDLFSDQTWLVNRIPEGRYTLKAVKKDGQSLRNALFQEFEVNSKTSASPLKLYFENA
jgi:hypothetical protein